MISSTHLIKASGKTHQGLEPSASDFLRHLQRSVVAWQLIVQHNYGVHVAKCDLGDYAISK